MEHNQHEDKAVPDLRAEVTELRDIMEKVIQRATEFRDQLNKFLLEAFQIVCFNNEQILDAIQ